MKQRLAILLAAFVISISSAANGTPGDILVTREDGVDVYDAPSSAANVLTTVDEGRKLKELRREGVWVNVIIYGELGKDGWVHSSSVTLESAGTENGAKPDVSADKSKEQAGIPPEPQFTLVITGSIQQRFQVRCKSAEQYTGLASEQKTIVEQVPKTYVIPGFSVSCRVHRLGRHPGGLRAELYEGERSKLLGAAETRAVNGCISVRSDGRWGLAWGVEGCARDSENW